MHDGLVEVGVNGFEGVGGLLVPSCVFWSEHQDLFLMSSGHLRHKGLEEAPGVCFHAECVELWLWDIGALELFDSGWCE